jgi:dihydrofolate reductase
MRKLVVFMHVTLDGFVAGPKGEMDWINVDDDIFEYAGKQTDLADTALYGKNTFLMMNGYWPTASKQPNASKHDIQHSNWYNQVKKVVLSKTLKEKDYPGIRIVRDNLETEINKLKQETGKNILIFGSPAAVHSLMSSNLIDDYWLFVNPILLGNGIPMFKYINERINVKLSESNIFSPGVVCLHYEKTK